MFELFVSVCWLIGLVFIGQSSYNNGIKAGKEEWIKKPQQYCMSASIPGATVKKCWIPKEVDVPEDK